jgi:hypothetical protein
MTHSIAERTLMIYTLKDSAGITSEHDIHGLKVGSFEGTITAQSILDAYPDIHFKNIGVQNTQEAAALLSSGDIDVFVSEAVDAIDFEPYDFIHSKEFFLLVYTSVSLSTANPELNPVKPPRLTSIPSFLTATFPA